MVIQIVNLLFIYNKLKHLLNNQVKFKTFNNKIQYILIENDY